MAPMIRDQESNKQRSRASARDKPPLKPKEAKKFGQIVGQATALEAMKNKIKAGAKGNNVIKSDQEMDQHLIKDVDRSQ